MGTPWSSSHPRNEITIGSGSHRFHINACIAFDFHAVSVTGADIDPDLITQAEKLLALRASRVRPPSDHSARSIDYFPISAVLTHGYRIEPKTKWSRTTPPASTLPFWPSVNFVAADWVASLNQDISGPFHVILALSVIKWIHLEHLDVGLKAFFKKCSQALHPGGHLIIELQTWDSYEKAIRPKVAPHFSQNLRQLQYRPETCFAKLLADEGLKLYTSSTALSRRIDVYCKVDGEV